MNVGQLAEAFKTYFEEMDRCASAKCFWALLHIVVVMPDICAALQSDDGEATRWRYCDWCDRNLARGILFPEERYEVRCILLHQGRTLAQKGRYQTYSFVQPGSSQSSVHGRVTPEEKNITLDVGAMAEEMRSGILSWFDSLQKTTNTMFLDNVRKNLPWLARAKPKFLPDGPGNLTNISSTSIDAPPATGSSSAGFHGGSS